MKNKTTMIERVAALAIAGGMLCIPTHLLAESTTYAPDPGDSSEQQRTVTGTEDTSPQPTRVGSMSAIGQKPSKAEREKQESQQGNAATKASSAANAMSDADRQFLMMAAKHGLKEVHMGQMAVQQGQSDAVKKLGRQIAADHAKANQQLMTIAARKGVKPATDHKMEKMSKRDTANFDQAWIGMMVNDHQKDIGLYQRQAQNGGDPELRKFAKNTLPVLQKHLKMVQQAQQKIASAGTNPSGMAANASTSTRTAR